MYWVLNTDLAEVMFRSLLYCKSLQHRSHGYYNGNQWTIHCDYTFLCLIRFQHMQPDLGKLAQFLCQSTHNAKPETQKGNPAVDRQHWLPRCPKKMLCHKLFPKAVVVHLHCAFVRSAPINKTNWNWINMEQIKISIWPKRSLSCTLEWNMDAPHYSVFHERERDNEFISKRTWSTVKKKGIGLCSLNMQKNVDKQTRFDFDVWLTWSH